jgi:hypothetical protein
LRGAKASRSRDDLEAFRVRADGDGLDEAVLPDAFGVLFPGRFVAEAAKSRMVEGGARSEEHIMDEPDPNPTLTAVAEWGQRKKHWLTARSLRRLQLEATRIDRKCHNVIGGNLRGRSISG